MNRLWVRLSLMIGGVLFFMFFMQFVHINIREIGGNLEFGGISGDPPGVIQSRLINFMGLSLLVGAVGGVVIARVVSVPIDRLAKAAHRIGAGELEVRVQERGSRELVELARAFNKMAASLQEAEVQRNNLMADVSHELRTPLTVMESNLRAVLDHVYRVDEAEIANLYEQTRHLIHLVNDLRELSLAEAGQLPLEKTATNLNNLVTETLQALEPLAAEKKITFWGELSPLPEIVVDPFRIRQVLFNLLSNALRHTPSGGKVSVTGSVSGNVITLSVLDTGEGLAADELAAVFNRFYRADKSRSRDSGGTGLGLAIVKAIIEAHGGQVDAKSVGKTQGSTFTLTLPIVTTPLR